MSSNPIFILGTSRCEGNTKLMVDAINHAGTAPVIDISKPDFDFYDYDHKNKQDGFIPLIEKISAFDTIVFATPVYWYSMSAPMKIFFDRLSDLLDIRKDLGRGLAGKRCGLIASGTSPELPEGFEIPFSLTANYFDMEYFGAVYHFKEKDLELSPASNRAAKEFAKLAFR